MLDRILRFFGFSRPVAQPTGNRTAERAENTSRKPRGTGKHKART